MARTVRTTVRLHSECERTSAMAVGRPSYERTSAMAVARPARLYIDALTAVSTHAHSGRSACALSHSLRQYLKVCGNPSVAKLCTCARLCVCACARALACVWCVRCAQHCMGINRIKLVNARDDIGPQQRRAGGGSGAQQEVRSVVRHALHVPDVRAVHGVCLQHLRPIGFTVTAPFAQSVCHSSALVSQSRKPPAGRPTVD